jgi:glyoxylase-like metal-dependent hydrolase (beta-lactamase superfamily II)
MFPAARLAVVVLLAIISSRLCSAQYAAQALDGVPATVTVNYVKTGLYFFSGGGGNSVLRLSGNGLILVDGKLAGSYDELRKQIHRISEQPVRVLVNTNHYQDHTGTNAKFLDDKTQVVAQQNVIKNLQNYLSPGGKVAPPSFTYDQDQTLHFGAVEVRLLHFSPARTDGDTVVYFPDLRAVAVGDLYSASPDPDLSAGGSLLGWSSALGKILELDFNVAVPGAGAPVSRADVEVLKAKIDKAISVAAQLANNGVPKDQLIARLKAADLGWEPRFSEEQIAHFYSPPQKM